MKKNYLLIIILSTFVFAFIRKITPGQPAFLEPATTVFVFTILIITKTLSKVEYLPNDIKIPILVWVLILFIYLFMSFYYSWKVGLTAFFTQIVPISMAIIGYLSLPSFKSWYILFKTLAIISILLLPFAIYGVINGSEDLPVFLRQAEGVLEFGKDKREGLNAFAGFYVSNSIQGLAFFSYFHLILAGYLDPRLLNKNKKLILFGLIAAFILVFLSTRRGVFWACTFSFGFLLINSKIDLLKRIRIIGLISTIGLLLFLMNLSLKSDKEDVGSRADLLVDADLGSRIEAPLNDYLIFWSTQTPMGLYLGAASPALRVLGMQRTDYKYNHPIEVGLSVLIVETGILGMIIFVIMVFWIINILWRISNHYKIEITIKILLLYQLWFFIIFFLKEGFAILSGGPQVFIFWAIPGISLALFKQINSQKQI